MKQRVSKKLKPVHQINSALSTRMKLNWRSLVYLTTITYVMGMISRKRLLATLLLTISEIQLLAKPYASLIVKKISLPLRFIQIFVHGKFRRDTVCFKTPETEQCVACSGATWSVGRGYCAIPVTHSTNGKAHAIHRKTVRITYAYLY